MEASRIEPEDIVHDFGLISSLPEIHSNSNTVLGSRKDKRIPELKQLMIHPFPINCFHGGNVTYFRDDALNAGLCDEDFNGNYGYEDIGFGQRLFADAVALEYQFQRVKANVAIVRTAPIIRLLINNRINIIPLSYGGGDRSRYVILPQMSCQTFLLHMPLMIRQKSQQKNQVSHYVLFAKKSKPVLMHL